MMAKKLPTDSDYANSNKNLEAEDYEVDYAITHTCPLYRVKTLGYYPRSQGRRTPSELFSMGM